MTTITTHFENAFKSEIQNKKNWHLGKPIEKRLNISIFVYMYLYHPLGFTFEQINLIIEQNLERGIAQFKGKCIEQVEEYLDRALL